MRKIVLPLITIYLAAILESSFLNYFPIKGQNLSLVILSFLLFMLLRPWTRNQLLILAFWTGLMLDVFCYSGFGLGIIAVLALAIFYQVSHRWFKTPQKITGQIIWYFFYNLLFYLFLEITNFMLVFLFPHYFHSLAINLSSISLLLLTNTGLAALIFWLDHQGRRIF